MEKIIYREGFPDKINVDKNSKDEIDNLSITINKLIDRLRYKELMLEENNAMKSEHIKQLSHDINTPLTAINLELYELAEDYCIPQNKIEHVSSKIIYTSELVKRVSETHNYSIENQYVFLKEINISLLLDKSLKKWKYLMGKHHIMISSSVPENIIWHTDKLLFERLLDNIFSNVIRHAETDEIMIDLNEHQLRIDDYGIGFILPENPSSVSGSGVIKSICAKLNLKLHIQSSEKGTQYTLENKVI
ncbi:sensor histidine kinase [Macrococcus equipercicus]|uniref:sensor histidine kinase n=1 Tax=Macrococcus equipercicus TaxID=69967 RepID=UPI0014786957|nr:HAMP domain-containing sensor histidine kinase [Macrococcus equipercicus]